MRAGPRVGKRAEKRLLPDRPELSLASGFGFTESVMPKLLQILFVEDDRYVREDITKKLARYGEVRATGDSETALRLLRDSFFDVGFFDLNLGGTTSGLDILRAATKRGMATVVLTGNSDPLMVARAYELGCQHYFNKGEVQKNFDRQLGYFLRSLSSDSLKQIIATQFVSRDEKLLAILQQLCSQNLNSDQRILLLGPTGVGKTKLAKLIHQLSGGSEESFIHLNLSEVPENLIESTLFGHRRGAFTGASDDHEGFLKKADGGTLFLDEIGSIPLPLQRKLLKVLEEKTYNPLGSTQVLHSDFRLISATCEDMPKLISSNRFRLDLYFRLKGVEVWIPPLSERRNDILPLVEFFAQRSARRVSFSAPALAALQDYDWYGNVRELEQVVLALSNSALGVIKFTDLPLHIQKNENPFATESSEEPKLFSKSILNFIQRHGLRRFIQSVEREAFKEIFERNAGNLTKTQQILGISKSAAYRIYSESGVRQVSGSQKEQAEWQ